jgi:hypothetical protein
MATLPKGPKVQGNVEVICNSCDERVKREYIAQHHKRKVEKGCRKHKGKQCTYRLELMPGQQTLFTKINNSNATGKKRDRGEENESDQSRAKKRLKTEKKIEKEKEIEEDKKIEEEKKQKAKEKQKKQTRIDFAFSETKIIEQKMKEIAKKVDDPKAKDYIKKLEKSFSEASALTFEIKKLKKTLEQKEANLNEQFELLKRAMNERKDLENKLEGAEKTIESRDKKIEDFQMPKFERIISQKELQKIEESFRKTVKNALEKEPTLELEDGYVVCEICDKD